MKISITPETIARIDGSVMHIIGVANELILVATEESQRLGEKQPMPIGDLLERKRKLVDEYEKWISTFRSQQHLLLHANQTLFEELLECNQVLSITLAENSIALKKAMAVSKRRVDTIMRAIREDRTPPAHYGGNGHYSQQNPTSVSIRQPYEA